MPTPPPTPPHPSAAAAPPACRRCIGPRAPSPAPRPPPGPAGPRRGRTFLALRLAYKCMRIMRIAKFVNICIVRGRTSSALRRDNLHCPAGAGGRRRLKVEAQGAPAHRGPRGGDLAAVWSHFQAQYSSPIQSEFIRAGRRRFRRLRAGTSSCGPGPQVYDYRGRGAPSHRLGRIRPYVRSCSTPGTDRERSDWRT